MRPFAWIALIVLPLLPSIFLIQNSAVTVTVDAAHPGPQISQQMFGVFFEDINFAADGGIYPELIKNRSFEFSSPLTGWHEIMLWGSRGVGESGGEIGISSNNPLNRVNPNYLHVRANKPGYGFYNAGFRGMGFKQGADYRFSFYARGNKPFTLRAVLVDEKGKEVGAGKIEASSPIWKRFETVIRANSTAAKGRLNLFVEQPAEIDLDMVSLFPTDTWNQRPNGLRRDIVQLLHDMHPGFVRFPGGCIVEGRTLINRYQWKTTVGDIAERKTIMNRWNDEFEYRAAPDYFQSFGLGFYEYFQLAEDIGARPLPIINCGMACQFNSSETAKDEDLKEYIQDALDLIEFANGPVTSTWGSLRARMGHPKPFGLEMIGVGNEQWGRLYVERYKIFSAAIKSKHPEIKLVVSAGPSPDGEQFEQLWKDWRQLNADLVDEHYYMNPKWFLGNATRYDSYSRTGPKVFAGEYAAHTTGSANEQKRNNWQSALAEAAFMTGLERNGDLVQMASYAPLLAHVDAWQWRPDAIWFDNLNSFGTPNYYVQKLFSTNVGTRHLDATPKAEGEIYTCASLDEKGREIIIKVVNTRPEGRKLELKVNGSNFTGDAKTVVLASNDLSLENTLETPLALIPKEATQKVAAGRIQCEIAANSVTVFRIPAR